MNAGWTPGFTVPGDGRPEARKSIKKSVAKAAPAPVSLEPGHKKRFIAPLVFEGSCKRDIVDTYFEKVLLPELERGSVVVLDNAGFHKSAKTQHLAQKHGIELMFLPAYWPDLNPIEHFWANLKRKLRPHLPHTSDPVSLILNMCQCYY